MVPRWGRTYIAKPIVVTRLAHNSLKGVFKELVVLGNFFSAELQKWSYGRQWDEVEVKLKSLWSVRTGGLFGSWNLYYGELLLHSIKGYIQNSQCLSVQFLFRFVALY